MGAKAKQPTSYPDILEAVVNEPSVSHYISDNFIRGRRIALRGIGVAVSFASDHGRVSLSPVIPCVGPALRLLQQHPKLNDITFNREKQRWEPTDWNKVKPCEPNTKKSKTRLRRGA